MTLRRRDRAAHRGGHEDSPARGLWLATMRHGPHRAHRSGDRLRARDRLPAAALGAARHQLRARVGTARRAQPGRRGSRCLRRRRRRRLGAGAPRDPWRSLPAIVWFAPEWVGWEGGPPLVRSLAMVLAPLLGVLLLHLALVRPGGSGARGRAGVRRGGRAERRAGAGARSVRGRALLEQLLGQRVPRRRATSALAQMRSGRCCWSIAARARPARGGRRRAAAPARGRVLVPAALAGVRGARRTRSRSCWSPDEDPSRTGFALLFAVRALTFAALGAGLAWVATRERRARAAVARLVAARSVRCATCWRGRSAIPACRSPTRCPAPSGPVDAGGAPLTPPVRARAHADRARGAAGGDRRARREPRRAGAGARDRRRRAARGRQRAPAGGRARAARGPPRLAGPRSSRPATRRAAGSSATSTTAPSSGCSRCRYELRLARAGATGEPADTLADGAAPRRRRRSTSCATSRTASTPRSSPRPASRPALTALAETAPVPVELGALPAGAAAGGRRDRGLPARRPRRSTRPRARRAARRGRRRARRRPAPSSGSTTTARRATAAAARRSRRRARRPESAAERRSELPCA